MAGVESGLDRAHFSKRLVAALAQQGIGRSITSLALAFNYRYPGKAITVHAVRKWVKGEAIPTQDKLQVLAEWLGVSSAWLRFGDGAGHVTGPPVEPLRGALTTDLAILSTEECIVVRALVDALFKVRASGGGGHSHLRKPANSPPIATSSYAAPGDEPTAFEAIFDIG
ncbi:MAG: hypothetical protein WKG03_14755 [Telluria sp.]